MRCPEGLTCQNRVCQQCLVYPLCQYCGYCVPLTLTSEDFGYLFDPPYNLLPDYEDGTVGIEPAVTNEDFDYLFAPTYDKLSDYEDDTSSD